MKIKLPVQRLDAEFSAAEANGEQRTVPMTFYAGAKVLQFDWEKGDHSLTLSMDPKHVRLGAMNSGRAPFTLGHVSSNDPMSTLGVISNARIEGSKAKADVRFSNRPEVAPILADVIDGILPNVSVGATLHKMKETTAEGDKMRSFMATDWEPFAVALVGVGADPGAHFAASAETETECEIEFSRETATKGVKQMQETNEQETGVLAERTRVLELTKIANVGKLDATFAAQHVKEGTSVEEFRRLAFEQLAARSASQAPTRSHHTELVRDSTDIRFKNIEEGLVARFTGTKPSEDAREFAGCRVSDLAREMILARGLRVPMSAAKTVELAMSTGDLPNLLVNTGHRVLMLAYEASRSKLMAACRPSTAVDFRAKAALRLGEAPKLLKVPEGGQISESSRIESVQSYSIYTYGRRYSITRQMLINDDLGAFATTSQAWGVAVSSMEADVLVSTLWGPAGVGPAMADTLALFHTTHGNIATAPGAPSDTTLSAARLALRTMKGVDGKTLIEVNPKFLIVPAALEGASEKMLTAIYPTATSAVNPFSQRFELLVEPRLDALSATGWYVAGDPALAPCIEYSHLDGMPGPQLIQEQNEDGILGITFYCFEDFGAGVIDSRGFYRNAG